MAKYQIKFSCGHCETVQLLGKVSDRAKTIANRERGLCKACYEADQQAKAEAHAIKHELAPLVGSPKQIAWANKIRFEKHQEIINICDALHKKALEANEAKAQLQADNNALVRTNAASIGEARWWIDHKDQPPIALCKILFKAQ